MISVEIDSRGDRRPSSQEHDLVFTGQRLAGEVFSHWDERDRETVPDVELPRLFRDITAGSYSCVDDKDAMSSSVLKWALNASSSQRFSSMRPIP